MFSVVCLKNSSYCYKHIGSKSGLTHVLFVRKQIVASVIYDISSCIFLYVLKLPYTVFTILFFVKFYNYYCLNFEFLFTRTALTFCIILFHLFMFFFYVICL